MLKDDLEFFRIIYRFFVDADKLTWTAIGLSALVGFFFFRAFFPKKDGFNDLPDDFTQGPDYQWLRLKIMMYVLIIGGTGFLAYHQLPDWFPHAFKR